MTASSTPAVDLASPHPGLGRFVTQVLSDREQFFAEVAAGEGLAEKLTHATVTLVALCALYSIERLARGKEAPPAHPAPSSGHLDVRSLIEGTRPPGAADSLRAPR